MAITVEDSNAPSTVRYEESFENYIGGTELLGFNGWYGTTPPAVTQSSYALPNNGDLPIPHAEHTQALQI